MASEESDTRPELGGLAPAVPPTEVVRLQGALPAVLRAEWRSLAQRVPEASYFQSPDWVLAWWETLGGRPPSECATWRDRSGSLEAVAMLSRRPERLHPRVPIAVPTWIVAGSGPGAADHVGFPSLERRRPDVWRWLAGRTEGAALLLRNVDPVAGPALVPPGARLLGRSACPRVDLWPDDGAGGSAKLRKQLRGYERRLEREGVRFRWLGPAMMQEDTVDLLFRLHERRRQLKDAPSSLLPGQRIMHQQLVATAKEYGDDLGPAAVVADYSGDPVGILYGFLWNGVFSFYQTGWEPKWSQLSLGTVLVSQAMQLSREHGASIFDFLRGVETYKYRFGATDRLDQTWIVPGGWSGRALHLKYRAKERLAGAGGACIERMKVLFVIDGLDEGGGSERSLIELLPELATAGIDAVVACLKVAPDAYGARQLEGVDVRLLPPGWFARLLRLATIVRAERPDLIHTSLFDSDIAGRLAALARRTPVLTSLVNTTYEPVRLGDPRVSVGALRAARAVDGFTARHLTSHFHAVSIAVKASAVDHLGIPPERITVVERGRDPARLGTPSPERRRRARESLGLTAEDEVLVSVGRQTYQKGHIHLLNAMAELVRVRPRLVWMLAGAEGDGTRELVAQRAALGLEGQVRYLGLRNDVAEVLAAADVFVHPSLYEGFPGALLEAMALGLPAVASDIAPVREAAEVDGTALVVPAGSPTLLAGAISALLDHPDRAAAFGARARNVFLDRYTAERSAARMTALLKKVAADAARQRRPWHLTPRAVVGTD